MEILFEEVLSNKDLLDVTKQAYSEIQKNDFKTIGLVATVQHIKQLETVRSWLISNNINVVIGKPGPRAKYYGQILGCDVGSANSIKDKADCIFYYGTGRFHALAVKYATDLPVFILDPFANTVSCISDQEKLVFLKKRNARIANAKNANTFGILISTKPGQNQINLAEELKNKAQSQGKKVFLFIADTFNPQETLNFSDIEVWVNTACPRIVEDQELYSKLLINVNEFAELLD